MGTSTFFHPGPPSVQAAPSGLNLRGSPRRLDATRHGAPGVRPQGGAAVPLQEDEEAVGEHGHAHQEVGQGQPVAGAADPPLSAVVAVEEHRVLEVALRGAPAVTLRPVAPHPARQARSRAPPSPHPQGPDGVQVVRGRGLGRRDALAGGASEGLACDELKTEGRTCGGKGPRGGSAASLPGPGLLSSRPTSARSSVLTITGGQIFICLARAGLGALSLDYGGFWAPPAR